MSAQHQVDLAGGRELEVLLAVGVYHRHHEIGALAPQRVGLLAHGRDRRRKSQVAGREARARVVVGRAGDADAHAVEGENRAILEARHHAAVGLPQVCGEQPELRLRHALEEHRLAEVELVVAGREHVGRNHVGERDDVRAAVDARHQRGRQRVAAHARRPHGRPWRARPSPPRRAVRSRRGACRRASACRPSGRCRWSG